MTKDARLGSDASGKDCGERPKEAYKEEKKKPNLEKGIARVRAAGKLFQSGER